MTTKYNIGDNVYVLNNRSYCIINGNIKSIEISETGCVAYHVEYKRPHENKMCIFQSEQCVFLTKEQCYEYIKEKMKYLFPEIGNNEKA